MIVPGHHGLEARSLDRFGNFARISGNCDTTDFGKCCLTRNTHHHRLAADVRKRLVGQPG